MHDTVYESVDRQADLAHARGREMTSEMPGKKVTFDTVRELGLALEDVEDGTAYGSFALKVRGSLLACMAIHKSAEPESLAVRIDFEQRNALLAEAPEIFYITDHYVNYPSVLVRLSRIRVDQMRDLLSAAWRFVTSKQRQTASRPRGVGGKKSRPRLKKPSRS